MREKMLHKFKWIWWISN